MISVVQRVTEAAVHVDGSEVARIDVGLLALVGAFVGDGGDDVEYLCRKLLTLRIFPDPAGRMNLSIQDVEGGLLVVSQFTLAANTRRGRRPSFARAMPPADAEPLIGALVQRLRAAEARVVTGVFGARMQVELINDGPVTVLLNSRQSHSGVTTAGDGDG